MKDEKNISTKYSNFDKTTQETINFLKNLIDLYGFKEIERSILYLISEFFDYYHFNINKKKDIFYTAQKENIPIEEFIKRINNLREFNANHMLFELSPCNQKIFLKYNNIIFSSQDILIKETEKLYVS